MTGTANHEIAALMERVRLRIAASRLTLKDAALLIGVGASTLQDHLAGEHVRSDSARKYENWLSGRETAPNVFALPAIGRQLQKEITDDAEIPAPASPSLVVDVFSGCGGLSLGFDLFKQGAHFRTILALDNQAAPIATLNRNIALLSHGDCAIGRIVDLTEFLNEAEFLAFYLQHVGSILDDGHLRAEFRALSGGAFPLFLNEIAHIDRRFLEALNTIRSRRPWRDACQKLDRRSVNQTSVLRFHDQLRLPRPSLKVASLPPLLWGEPASEFMGSDSRHARLKVKTDWLIDAQAEWDDEVALLVGRQEGAGRGQLTASGRRLSTFADFLASDAMASVRDAWSSWRAQRLALRAELFCDKSFADDLQKLYNAHARVSVVVGGPPCQGFSRIGRGKIRSLRDARIHAHSDSEAGDTRNRLFQQYVMVLGALRPDVFLFENVAQFQSVVKVDGVAFQATELLVEAIHKMSDGEVSYEVSPAIIDASKHGIPQTRQRYFMAGVLRDDPVRCATGLPADCLNIRRDPEAVLSLALAGLPAPGFVGGDVSAADAMAIQHTVEAIGAMEHPFTRWIRQARPGTKSAPATVDAHACRAPRSDDAALFALMGPGRRWMDYRADQASTISAVGSLLDLLLALPDDNLPAGGSISTRYDRAPLPASDPCQTG